MALLPFFSVHPGFAAIAFKTDKKLNRVAYMTLNHILN